MAFTGPNPRAKSASLLAKLRARVPNRQPNVSRTNGLKDSIFLLCVRFVLSILFSFGFPSSGKEFTRSSVDVRERVRVDSANRGHKTSDAKAPEEYKCPHCILGEAEDETHIMCEVPII